VKGLHAYLGENFILIVGLADISSMGIERSKSKHPLKPASLEFILNYSEFAHNVQIAFDLFVVVAGYSMKEHLADSL
jgi:hypothetical protein